MSLAGPPLVRLGFRQALRAANAGPIPPPAFRLAFLVKSSSGFQFCRRRCNPHRSPLPIAAIDENSSGIAALLEEGNGSCGGKPSSYVLPPIESESESDGLLVYPSADAGLQTSKDRLETLDPALKVPPAHQFIAPQQVRKRRRIRPGILINVVLLALSAMFLLFFDWWSWRIVRLPLERFYLTHPFSISAVLSACAGWLYIPIVDNMRIHQILRKEGPKSHFYKKGTPTMGGLFFIPIGVTVAIWIAGPNSVQVYGAAVATLAFAAIGLLDDLLSCIKSHNYGLPGWIKLSLQAAVGTWFSFWLDSTNITTPYNMKLLVPLPPPFGLVYLGKYYMILTAFCFAAMGNGVNLTDGLDGLAGGAATLAFIGMAVSVLAICPELAIFGASMAGACIGFLFHNRYKASIFMGDTGSLALGGALAAMASCTGMFFPLLISSGVFVMEVLSVIVQVLVIKVTKRIYGVTRRFFRMAPVHHHFELGGVKEPIIVASAYVVSLILALVAGYIGLISA